MKIKKTMWWLGETTLVASVIFAMLMMAGNDSQNSDLYGYSDLGLPLQVCLAFATGALIVLIFEWILMFTLPDIEVQATLQAKGDYRLPATGNSSTSGGFSYMLVFKLENGRTELFVVTPLQYSCYFEGNKGVLKYREHLFKDFRGFYVEEVE